MSEKDHNHLISCAQYYDISTDEVVVNLRIPCACLSTEEVNKLINDHLSVVKLSVEILKARGIKGTKPLPGLFVDSFKKKIFPKDLPIPKLNASIDEMLGSQTLINRLQNQLAKCKEQRNGNGIALVGYMYDSLGADQELEAIR